MVPSLHGAVRRRLIPEVRNSMITGWQPTGQIGLLITAGMELQLPKAIPPLSRFKVRQEYLPFSLFICRCKLNLGIQIDEMLEIQNSSGATRREITG